MAVKALFSSLFSSDLAIDMGTSNTVIYQKGNGIVCNEPSVVAVQAGTTGRRKVLAVGAAAKAMLGRTPDSITAIRPIKDGVITDFEAAQEMLRQLIRKVQKKNSRIFPQIFNPQIIICVPYGITEVEKRAVREAAESAGAKEVFLIEEPMAGAIGAGLPITEACGSMILDVGGGTAEIAIISLKGIVYSQAIRMGGDKMDDAIANYVKRRYNVLIGERTAEQIKVAIGSAMPTGENLTIEIRGRDLVQGVPRAIKVSEEEVRDALVEPINQVLELVRTALEKTPPELSSDIVEKGITLTGGNALLRNLDKLISKETGIPVVLVDDPMTAVVQGAGAVLDQMDLLKDVILQ